VTLRISLSLLFAFVISFVDAPILNANTRLLLAIVVPFVALLMPTLIFAYGGIILPMAMLFLMAYAFVTALLATAVAGGDGAFVALMSIFIFWMSFLRWEKATGPGTSLLIIAVVFVSVLSFPNYRVVQDGIDVVVKTLDGPDAIDTVSSTFLSRNTIPEMLSNQYSEILLGLLNKETDGNENNLFEVPSDGGDLAGMTVEIIQNGSIGDDEYVIFHVPGGMWMVRAMWTMKGVTNPLAMFYNLFLFWGWLFLSLALIYFIPPFRTLRLALSKGMIPAALVDTSAYIDTHSSAINAAYGEEDNNNDDEEPTKQKVDLVNTDGEEVKNDGDEDATKKKLDLRGKLLRHANVLFGGNLATLTAFEPRLSRTGSSLPVCTWIRLKTMSDAVLKCVLVSIGIEELLKETDHEEFREIVKYHAHTTKSLKSCATALQTGKAAFDKDDQEEVFDCKAYDPFRMKVHTEAVVESTKSYLLAMDGRHSNHSGSPVSGFFSWATFNEIKLSILPFLFVFTAYLKGLASVLIMLCKKSYWVGLFVYPYSDLHKLIWCLKYTTGFVSLLVMTVYWKAFNERFSVTTSLPEAIFESVFSTLNGGWAMIAYCFATTQSTEGSVKKGILRALGTVAGGFLGWVALRVCQDSRFESGFNPYGLVSWLTITSTLATYSATNRGFFARLGLSSDFSFGPIYFVITEVVVIMYCELFFGPDGINDVAVNRVISNLVGIGVAVLLALLPPAFWGGSPYHCREIVDTIEKSASSYLQILLDCRTASESSDFEKISKDVLKKKDHDLAHAVRLHGLAKDFFEDASRLSAAPFLKTDPRLHLELALIALDIYVVSFVAIIASRIISNQKFRRLAMEEDIVRQKLESFFETFEQKKSIYTDVGNETKVLGVDIEGGDDEETKEAKLLIELFLRILRMLQQRVKSHHLALDSIKWGYRFRSSPSK